MLAFEKNVKFKLDIMLKNNYQLSCDLNFIGTYEKGKPGKYLIDIINFKNILKDYIEAYKKEYKIEKELIIDKSHYKQGTHTINIIKKELRNFNCISGFYLGNIIKYVERYKYKHNEVEEQLKDLLKASEYLDMYLQLFFNTFYDDIKEYYITIGSIIGQNEFIE